MEVYLDNASTTGVSKEVYTAMKPYLKSEFGNPSSLHSKGIKVRKIINGAHKQVASLLNCNKNEIYFTSCGTESINWALKGLAFGNKTKGEIITTKIEHHATLHTVEFLEELGYIIHYLDVDKQGFINLDQLRSLVNDNTLVVSIILANNEIGTIQNITEISEICEEARTYLHLDAVQALTHIPINLKELKVDLMSISGHKFHAPKGVGILYVKEGTHITNLIHGGQQENSLRSGTENVPYIIGIAKALEVGIDKYKEYEERLNKYTKYFLSELDKANVNYILNGPKIGRHRLPGNLNLSFKEFDGSDITYYLNKANIYVSTGSACDSTSIEPSHVLKAICVPNDYINASIRFSIGEYTTKEEVNYCVSTLIGILNDLK
ncbi:Cysteine desulfurase [Candidatus Izimaplasma bacterium HR1]|jgi:cysteine desulfurase|uniref:cysteine desulfurase family protein n=1 Tax=Candidatus Izimoplasma sp. HR1 TaxID=1541959 RepID=UPI0004F80532|nr:Cysteine desulfurase [Candidatus Izimaplasma bacterium HR1]